MSDISKIKLASGKEYNIKDSYARELIGAHTHPIDTELDDSSTNPVQNSVITNALNNKADANHTHNLESLGIVYGKCFNMENILAKKVSLPDYVLCNNSIVSIKFNYNVKQNSTLNINNTGDKPIYYDNKSIINNIIKAGDTATFIYDGTNYNLISLNKNSYARYFEVDNEIITNLGQRIHCNGRSDDIYSYNLIKNNIIYIKFKYFVYANATLNISLSGDIPIYYNNTPIKDGIIRPNDIGVFIYDGTNYNLISVYTLSSTCINSYYFTCSRYEGTKYAITNSYTAGFAKFNKGDIVAVHFNDNIDDDNSTLQIGSNNNGYLPICNRLGSPMPGGIIKANYTLVFIYDETKYRCIYSFNRSYLQAYSNDGTYQEQESATCSTATEQIFKETTLFRYSHIDIYHFAGAITYITFENAVPANSTLNNKPIYYKGYPIIDGIINAGDTAMFMSDGTNLHLISLTNENKYSSSNISNILFNIDRNKADNTHTHNIASMGFGFNFCNTTTETADKTASISNYTLNLGGVVSIKFNYAVLANATLNINDTGAKSIYYKGSAITDGIIKAGDIATFIYDGTNYNLISLDRDFNPITIDTALSTTSTNPVENNVITNALNNHTHTNESMGFGYGTCSTAASTTAKTVSISNYKLSDGGIVSIKFNYDVLAGATLNINSTGAKSIYYNGAAITDNIIKAGDTVTFIYDSTNYNLISLDRNFNFTNESIGFGYSYANYSCFCGIVDDDALTDGNIIIYEFNYNVKQNSTLNINNTGDKPIYYNGSPITDGIIEAGDIAILKYNENLDLSFSRFVFIGLYDDHYILDANNSNSQEEINIDVSIYEIINGQNFNIRFDYDVPANATLNLNINGIDDAKPIYYNGSPITDGIIEAGDTATFIYNINDDRYDLLATDNYNNENVNHYYHATALICYRITLDGYTQTKGGIVSIKFNYDVLAGATLNINSTGAKSIYHNGYLIRSDIIKAGDIATFIYDETGYHLIATDNTSNESMGFGYGTCTTVASTTAKKASVSNNYKLTKNGIVSIRFSYDVPADATLNINSTGAKSIYYNGVAITDNIIKARDTATFIYNGTNYRLISLDRDFNPITVDSSLSTTSTNPVQNSVITNALNNKADANHTHTDATASSGGLMSATDKANIDNFAANFKNKLSIANGIATLDSNGRVPSTQLPSYVDDIIEGYLYNNTLYEEDTYTTEIIGETGKIYVDLSTNKTYRWGGSNYIEISESLALGETSSTAYRGDYGKIAYEHAQSTNNPHNVVPSVYGYCSTARMQETKIVTINDFKLIPGMIIFIRFTYGVNYQAYLNISNTGAKPIYYKGKINDLCVTENGSSDIIQAGDIVTFIYDAANNRYNLISTNIISNQRMGSGDAYCDTAASVNEKSVSIKEYVPFEGGIVSIYFVNAVNANSKLKINNYSSVSIWYRNSYIGNGIIKAGDRATFMYTPGGYFLISLDRDFNDPITIDSSLSTTSTNPVQNSVITNALNNYMPTIIGTQIESTNNWTGNAQFETLEDGQRILYYLPYDNSSGSDVVLNLTLADGTTQTGNIDCYLSGSARLNSQYEAGSFIPLIYKENIIFNGSSTTYTGWWAYTDKDIDSKVQNTLNNTTKAYVTGTTNNTTNIGTQIFDDNVYLGTTAGELNTKSLKLNEKVTLNYNTNNNCIDFIFS